MKIPVPYHSQFTDISDPYWMLRGCAIVCLKMVLDFYGKEEDIMRLIEEGIAIGGYGKSGWFHDSVIAMAKKRGIESFRKEKMADNGIFELKEALASGNPVIVSGSKRFMGQTKFHMIVLTGFEEVNGEVTSFYYHDSENTDKERAENDRERGYHREVSIEDFNKDWRRMAIFFKKI